ncbi:MAG TPA: hypothetical protein VFB38_20485 [Chthonomonadaceae bacterium]|nr:hypothetical protein [Chthonomonadaceae bacterium]
MSETNPDALSQLERRLRAELARKDTRIARLEAMLRTMVAASVLIALTLTGALVYSITRVPAAPEAAPQVAAVPPLPQPVQGVLASAAGKTPASKPKAYGGVEILPIETEPGPKPKPEAAKSGVSASSANSPAPKLRAHRRHRRHPSWRSQEQATPEPEQEMDQGTEESAPDYAEASEADSAGRSHRNRKHGRHRPAPQPEQNPDENTESPPPSDTDADTPSHLPPGYDEESDRWLDRQP